MVGPYNENSAIWQVQEDAINGAQSTATNTNTIWFNPDNLDTPDTQSIIDFDVDFRRASPENSAVNSDNNELQDMGVSGLDIIITGKIKNANSNNTHSTVNKLSKWILDGNTTSGFTKGRYGLQLASLPQFNITPTSTFGFYITRVHYTKLSEKDTIQVTIELALSGDVINAI